jgi:signal transduction histidine kinase
VNLSSQVNSSLESQEALNNALMLFLSKPHGTGMGLTRVHQIVSDHRREIQIDSAPGQGTVVIIRLPCWPVK